MRCLIARWGAAATFCLAMAGAVCGGAGEVASRVKLTVEPGHPWTPPFGLERVGRPMDAVVEVPAGRSGQFRVDAFLDNDWKTRACHWLASAFSGRPLQHCTANNASPHAMPPAGRISPCRNHFGGGWLQAPFRAARASPWHRTMPARQCHQPGMWDSKGRTACHRSNTWSANSAIA